MMSDSDYCLHTGSQHGDDHTGVLIENKVTGSANITLTREGVARGGDNVRECFVEIPTEKPETVSEVGQSTTVLYTAIKQCYYLHCFNINFQMVCRQW